MTPSVPYYIYGFYDGQKFSYQARRRGNHGEEFLGHIPTAAARGFSGAGNDNLGTRLVHSAIPSGQENIWRKLDIVARESKHAYDTHLSLMVGKHLLEQHRAPSTCKVPCYLTCSDVSKQKSLEFFFLDFSARTMFPPPATT